VVSLYLLQFPLELEEERGLVGLKVRTTTNVMLRGREERWLASRTIGQSNWF
jgi:hypothetical protein